MTGTDELAGRLEAWGQNCADPDFFRGDALSCVLADCAEVAAALRALRAERDEARAERDAFYSDGLKAEDKWIEQENRAITAEATLAKRAQEIAALLDVLEPFDDALGEDDEGYGDGLTVVLKWGACTDYSVTLGDLRALRRARSLAQGETT